MNADFITRQFAGLHVRLIFALGEVERQLDGRLGIQNQSGGYHISTYRFFRFEGGVK
jgi:hypothetical protein